MDRFQDNEYIESLNNYVYAGGVTAQIAEAFGAKITDEERTTMNAICISMKAIDEAHDILSLQQQRLFSLRLNNYLTGEIEYSGVQEYFNHYGCISFHLEYLRAKLNERLITYDILILLSDILQSTWKKTQTKSIEKYVDLSVGEGELTAKIIYAFLYENKETHGLEKLLIDISKTGNLWDDICDLKRDYLDNKSMIKPTISSYLYMTHKLIAQLNKSVFNILSLDKKIIIKLLKCIFLTHNTAKKYINK